MALFDVIKYEGSSEFLVLKHPIRDFNSKATLIVHEKQEAIVMMDGVADQIYGKGKHLLTSRNHAGIKHIAALFSGGELANHCEVYFVNKLLFSNIPWVISAMDIQDRTMGNYYSFRAQGFYNVRISNAYDLFEIMGNADYFSVEDLKSYFNEQIASIAREVLSIAMNQNGLSYGEINSHITQLSQTVAKRILPEFARIGLELVDFRFDSINLDKDAEFNKHREQLSERAGQKIENRGWIEPQLIEVLKEQAKNQGTSGSVASVAAGSAFGMGIGQAYGGMMGNTFNSMFNGVGMPPAGHQQDPSAGVVAPHPVNIEDKAGTVCKNCGRHVEEGWKCCPYCGQSLAPEQSCPNCGAVLPNLPDICYCPACRTRIK